jgi:hypothetical protein
MAVTCPYCGRQYDITLFQYGRTVTCACGQIIDDSHVGVLRELERVLDNLEDRRKAKELKTLADRVCQMILDRRCADVDIDIAINRVREKCRELFSDKLYLFEMIYGSRFRRLREQFRKENSQ